LRPGPRLPLGEDPAACLKDSVPWPIVVRTAALVRSGCDRTGMPRRTKLGGHMIKAILMSVTLIALCAGAADATVIYNWRT